MGKPREEDSCSTIRACYSVYPVAEVAALWCGVAPEDVKQELWAAVPVGETKALSRAILRHPYLPCLEPRIRAIQLAIDSGELDVCREDGRRVPKGEHVAYERRHVYGLELKEWAKSIAPSERPAFLFDDVERGIHVGITQDVYQSLKAAHDAKEQSLVRANALIRELEDEKGRTEAEAVVFDVFRAARDAWLAWPAKVAPFVAAELGVEVDAVAMLLSEYVYRQLQELGEPQPDFTDR